MLIKSSRQTAILDAAYPAGLRTIPKHLLIGDREQWKRAASHVSLGVVWREEYLESLDPKQLQVANWYLHNSLLQ